ncbi:sensor histidine kinase [Paenibacillus sp. GCM10027626]|uniref:sensor histidine kinase n=1 Tax=Paenibacillus sp. GCM10027626 TaxID=3273411 RepID=UPI00362A44C1
MKRQIYRYFDQLRFKHKLFLSYLTVILIPISVLGAYAYNQSREMLDLQALQGIEKNVNTISDSISSSAERYNHTIRSMMYNKTFQKIVGNDYIDLVNLSRDLKEYLTPYLIMMTSLDKDIEKVTFYTQRYVPEYGDSVLSAGRVEQERWYEEAARGTGSQTRWFYDDGLFVTGTFPDMSAERKDFVYMRINDASFFKNVAELAREYGIMIVDKNKQVIYGNQEAAGTALTADNVMTMKEGMVTVGKTGLFLVKKAVPKTDWTIYCLVPAAQVSPNAGSILNATLVIILVCIVTLLIIISIFSKTMISRIYKLNMLMKRVETGELDLRVRSTSKDEIGELTNGFGNMLVRLNELIDESYRSKIVQKEAELKALQWQINPHFLYNTLSFINWQALRSDAHDISHVVTAMAKFYRTALNRGNNIISVREELDNIMSYVEIIQVMSEHSFDVTYDIDEQVCQYATINLILQPLAENAIKHGINMKTAGRGLLQVSARMGEGTILFAVQDNGPGMSQETVERILSMQAAGYGLRNVNERLHLLFGAEYGISIQSEPGAGTVMLLTIPQYKQDSA